MTDRARKLELLNDPEFRELSRKKNRISFTLTALTMVVYYGFIFMLAFKKEFFGHKITPNITIGMPIGIGVILLSWAFTGIYVRWANRRYDLLVKSVKSKVAHGPPGQDPRVS